MSARSRPNVRLHASAAVAALVAIAALGLLGGCRDEPNGATAAARATLRSHAVDPPATVTFRRADSLAIDLLKQGGVWDAPSRPAAASRPLSSRVDFDARGFVVLHEQTLLGSFVGGRTTGRLQLRLHGDVRGAAAKVRVHSAYFPIPGVEKRESLPPELAKDLPQPLAEFDWPAGARDFASPLFDGDRVQTWMFVSVETASGASLTLERLELDEVEVQAVARRLVGAETRPALPIAVGAKQPFELGELTAGSTVELALALPETLVRTDTPVSVRCELPGSVEGELTVELSDAGAAGPAAAPVRRFRDVVFHVGGAARTDRVGTRSLSSSTLTLAVSGPAGRGLFATPPIVEPRRTDSAGPSVLLISLDTLRADRVGAFGSTSGATPNLDRFAQRCFRFTRCTSPANFTTPAHASMMTGLEPCVHGAQRFGQRVSIRPWPNLAGALASSGMTTAAFTGGGLVDAAFGFDEHFGRYQMLDVLMTPKNPRYAESPRHAMPDYDVAVRAGVSLHTVTDFVEQHADRRFFLFFHTYHVHDYTPSDASERRFGVAAADDAKWPLPFDLDPKRFPSIERGSPQVAHYSKLYDASLSEADAAIGELLATLERTHALEHTVVLVTADHGEAFKEHENLFHTVGLYDEVLHVPLLLFVPRPELAPRAIDTPVSLVDVAPTLIELAGAAPLSATQGVSLVPLLRGEELAARALLSQDAPAESKTERGTVRLTNSAIVIGNYKYVRTMRSETELDHEQLFDVVADPKEQHDLASDPAFASALAQARAALDRVLADRARAAEQFQLRRDQYLSTGADLDEEMRRLGYG